MLMTSRTLICLVYDAVACRLRISPPLQVGLFVRVRRRSERADECYADVVKTRLQVEARTGQTNYKGMGDAFVKICLSNLNLME